MSVRSGPHVVRKPEFLVAETEVATEDDWTASGVFPRVASLPERARIVLLCATRGGSTNATSLAAVS